jgi:hypothetical protein
MKTTDTQSSVATLRRELKDLIEELATQKYIDTFDVSLLTLRLGLEREKCATLTETGRVLQRSTECIRSHQYLILKRKIPNPLFFQKLEAYGQYVKLPLGIFPRKLSL